MKKGWPVKFNFLKPQSRGNHSITTGNRQPRRLVTAAVALWLGLILLPVVKADSWTNTGTLNTVRDAHTAILLPTGKVLVAGGEISGAPFPLLSTAELYDPATGLWTVTGSLSLAREYHTATLLTNGVVLVAGGEAGGATSSAELYDPATGMWTNTGAMNTARLLHTATLLPSGKVLVAGGNNATGSVSSAELYDPATGIWTATSSSSSIRDSHTATLLPSGMVLVAGGVTNVFEGGTHFTGLATTAELYDPITGAWTDTGALNAVRRFYTATLLPNGKVVAVGGEGIGGLLSSAELYDPATGKWTPTSAMKSASMWHTATLLPGGPLVVTGGGGTNNHFLSRTELYNPATGTWTMTSVLGNGRGYHTATLLPNGKVLVAGGIDEYAGPLSTAELYTRIGVSIALYSGVTPGLTIDGVVGQTYGVQATKDLGNMNTWDGLTNITLTTPTQTWYDSQPAVLSHRFYRVVPGPISTP